MHQIYTPPCTQTNSNSNTLDSVRDDLSNLRNSRTTGVYVLVYVLVCVIIHVVCIDHMIQRLTSMVSYQARSVTHGCLKHMQQHTLHILPHRRACFPTHPHLPTPPQVLLPSPPIVNPPTVNPPMHQRCCCDPMPTHLTATPLLGPCIGALGTGQIAPLSCLTMRGVWCVGGCEGVRVWVGLGGWGVCDDSIYV